MTEFLRYAHFILSPVPYYFYIHFITNFAEPFWYVISRADFCSSQHLWLCRMLETFFQYAYAANAKNWLQSTQLKLVPLRTALWSFCHATIVLMLRNKMYILYPLISKQTDV